MPSQLTHDGLVGARPESEANRTQFRLWAPLVKTVDVVFGDGRKPAALSPEEGGYWSGFVENTPPGTLYKLAMDGSEAYPDPGSRFQPDGPHGWSQIVDAGAFTWTDEEWKGSSIRGQVIYEMHVGTFTQTGTWKAASAKLGYLRDTGITLIEVMPVADYPGRFGWGYDGVLAFAPVALYGSPDDLRSFVNEAHGMGIGVILDVVYNHLGPDGNYLPKFSPFYLSKKHRTDWGQALNFDGEQSKPVRDYFCGNAAYWIRDFHLDGLRFDATQDIHDESRPHILQELGAAARIAAGPRQILLIGENEPQDTKLIRPIEAGGYGFDALWNDDYHHSAIVGLTGKADAYYTDYLGTPEEFVTAAKYGYLFQGQWYRWQKKRRGTPTFGLPKHAMVNFIQNHDQIANSARGQRIHESSSPGNYKAMTALTLLMPGTPMLFQGQEFAASTHFFFFADHKPELAEKIRKGRVEFLSQWRSLVLPEMKKCFEDPSQLATFERSKLDHTEVQKHCEIYALHRDLITLRREDPIISLQGESGLDGVALSNECLLLRYFSPDFGEDRLLFVNLGRDLELSPAPEPLLAPPLGKRWMKLWSSDDPQYGGCGTAVLDSEENWKIPGRAAVLLHPIATTGNKDRTHTT